jgi:hypothetical protein
MKRPVGIAFLLIALSGCEMEKPSSTLYLQRVVRGGVLINNPETAKALASAYIVDLYGKDELPRQQPLSVNETADTWVVAGGHNRDKALEGSGPVSIVIGKNDGRILDATLPYVVHVPRPAHEK